MARITPAQIEQLKALGETGAITEELLEEFLQNPGRFTTALTASAKEKATCVPAELAAAVVRHLPRRLPDYAERYWLVHPERLETALLRTLDLFEAMRYGYGNEVARAEWTLLDDVELTDFMFDDLELVEFGEDEEIVGEALRERAKTLGANLGLADAPRIIRFGTAIRKKMEYDVKIVLPGTLFRAENGEMVVPYLRWEEFSSFFPMVTPYGAYRPAVIPLKHLRIQPPPLEGVPRAWSLLRVKP